MNHSCLRALFGCFVINLLIVGPAGPLCAAEADAPCPKGESRTDEGCMKPPKPRHKVKPAFPKVAQRQHEEGHVTLHAGVMEDGSVTDIEVKSCTNPGHGFEEAATDALRKWRY